MKAPKTPAELFGRALAYHRAGRTEEAESFYRKVIFRNPKHIQALFGLGGVLFESGRYAEASRFLERLVAVCPDEPMYLTNLGEAYRRQGALDRAAAAFERALAEDPDLAEAHQNLGITLVDAGAPADALPHLERAVALQPNHLRFRVSLAWALLKLYRVEESIVHCRRAVELDPVFAPAHHHLASALTEHGDRSGAIASYRRAVELDPSDYDAHSNLILVALTDPSHDAVALLAETRACAKVHAEPLREHWRPHANVKNPRRPLRIGYVSPDFRAHPVQQFLIPLFQHHDPSVVEVILYASVDRPDFVTEKYRAIAGERYRDIRRVDDASADALIRRDQIDILVDLALHGAGNRLRLFARKPAPVQMTWVGYAGTTGLDAMDYRITDSYFDPPGSDLGVYSETSLHLPESYWCYDALEVDLPVGPLPALGAGHITFGCLNSPRKVHPGVLSLWARVLRAIPGSRLFVYIDDHAQDAVRRILVAEGVEAGRIDLGGRVSRRQYLERYNRIDIVLDTFPFAGGTTSLDAIWMGVPFVTLTGAPTLQRAGLSIAMNLGLPELVANSPDQFVTRAVDLSSDVERLGQWRAGLRARLAASPFGDVPRFARNLESIYRTAWLRYCADVTSSG